MIVVADAGLLDAAFDASDSQHERALRLLRRTDVEIVTNLPVISEVAFLLHPVPHTRLQFLSWVGKAIEVDADTIADLPRMIKLLSKYSDLRPDFIDASLIALCERLRTRRIATIDRDFEIYRTLSNMPFETVFPSR